MPRSIPKGLGVKIYKKDVKVLPIFKLIQERGNIAERDMFNTFNMGVGMSVVVSREDEEKTLKILQDNGVKAYTIGEIIKSEDGVVLL